MNGTATVALKGNSLFQFCNWKAEGLYLSRICYRVDSVKQKVDDIFQPRKNRFLIHFVKGSSLKEVLDKDRQLLQGHLKLVLIKLQHWKVFSTFFRGEVGENGMRRDWLIRSDATGEVLVPATRSFPEHPHPFFHGSFGCSNKGVANVEHHLRDDEPSN
ncbi:hypothetical protein DKX38_022166 [Salix brachista]|uniref:Uncharacterized protein n=1 Tax=Salix brachista TaxID=2182728 RepID=A0A5N5KAX7_9ROSI|nr:hypothetical protein DKX38_022166 [Salix brachista]